MRRELRLSRRDRRRLEEAIARAEVGHRGEIRVHLEARYRGEGPVARARELYHALGMQRTEGDTAALLYVAWADRRVALWHGQGLDGAGAPGFWKEVTDLAARALERGEVVAGLARAVAAIGEQMRAAAPGKDVGNELPNAVSLS